MSLVSQFLRDNLQQISHQPLEETQKQFQSSNQLIEKLAQIRQSENIKINYFQMKIDRIQIFLQTRSSIILLCQNRDKQELFKNVIQILFGEKLLKLIMLQKIDNIRNMITYRLNKLFINDTNYLSQQQQMRQYLHILKNMKESYKNDKKVSREFLIKTSKLDSNFQEYSSQFQKQVTLFNAEVQTILQKLTDYQKVMMSGFNHILQSREDTVVTPMKQIANQEKQQNYAQKWNTSQNLFKKSYYPNYQTPYEDVHIKTLSDIHQYY